MQTKLLMSALAFGLIALPVAANRSAGPLPGPAPASSQGRTPLLRCRAPRAIDGDTIRCGNIRAPLRLLGIDAPELPGHCRRGRKCVAGDPIASRAALAASLRPPVTVQGVGQDRYRRTIAIIRARGTNLSCLQLARGHATYVPRWDAGHAIKRECAK